LYEKAYTTIDEAPGLSPEAAVGITSRLTLSMRDKLHEPDGWCSAGLRANE
jgi:hypothetical protein